MTYRVVWNRAAEADLASVWIGSRDRAAVTAAAHRLDESLREAPEETGESRDKGCRIGIESPLVILFRVEPSERTVYVLAAWSRSTRPGKG